MTDLNATATLESYGFSEPEFERALAYRERFEPGEALEARPAGLPSAKDVAAISPEKLREMVSAEGYRKTIEFETGGKGYYERRLKKPSWPGGASGVTIGVGYDVGYHSEKEVSGDWGDQIPAQHLEKLLSTVGYKGERARGLIGGLSEIAIPWEVAEVVFVRATLPKYARLVVQNLLNVNELHPHCFGALFSLVFNRGASFYNSGDRYAEMRNIARHMQNRAFDKIPGEFVAMKRIWGSELSGLLKRRDAEAALFRKGLEEASKPRPAPVAAADVSAATGPTIAGTSHAYVAPQGFESAQAEAAGRPAGEAREDWQELEVALERAPAPPRPEAYKGKWYEADDVSWSKDDAVSPDYRHLKDRGLAGRDFTLTAKDLDLLMAANRYEPVRSEGRILFGLRGCRLAGDKSQIDTDTLHLRDSRPDHRNFRCVVGVYNTTTMRLSGFVASTVPNVASVLTGWQRAASGSKEHYGNLLSTGLYPYVVGPHGSGPTPGCFLQGTSFEKRAEVIVLRSLKDVTYDAGDFWHKCEPHDNLHPAFRSSSGFSSAGCQTVRGNYTNGAHTADFAALRDAAGLGRGKDNGKRFDYMLLTGLEAAIASNLRERGLAADKGLVDALLGRLRQGSKGEEVKKLQAALGRPVTGILDAEDRKALIERQRAKVQFADAVHSPEWDGVLGFNVFAPAAPPPDPLAVAVAPLESARAGGMIVADDRTSRTLEDDQSVARLRALSGASPDSLFYEIGLRSRIAAESGRAGALEAAVATGGRPEFGFDVLRSVGASIFGRVEADLHAVLCGGQDKDAFARDSLAAAMARAMSGKPQASDAGADAGEDVAGEVEERGRVGGASPAAIDSVSRILVARFGILPLLAQPIAALLLDQVFKSTLQETCAAWSSRFARPAATPVAAAVAPAAPVAGAAPAAAGAALEAHRMQALLTAPEDELLTAIGRESRLSASSASAAPALGLEAMPSAMSLLASGRKIYDMAEAQLYAMLCEDDPATSTVREQIGRLYAMPGMSDRATIASALGALLVSQVGFIPFIAAPIAALLVSKFFKAGLEETCKHWGAARGGASRK